MFTHLVTHTREAYMVRWLRPDGKWYYEGAGTRPTETGGPINALQNTFDGPNWTKMPLVVACAVMPESTLSCWRYIYSDGSVGVLVGADKVEIHKSLPPAGGPGSLEIIEGLFCDEDDL